MSKRIIISGKERRLNPFISFVLSLLLPGTGETYSGSPQRGTVLALLRGISLLAVPFYSMTNVKSSYLTEVFFSLLVFLLITLFSPFNAFIISFKKKKIVVYRLSSGRFISLFIICNIIITILSASIFFSFFSIIRIRHNSPPLIETGDIVVIKKSENKHYLKGEMTALRDGNLTLARIIGTPGESLSYNKGRFSVEGSELFLSIFSENELKNFYLADFDVISETQGNFIYPVIQNRDKYSINITLEDDEYFTAPDDRNKTEKFLKVNTENMYGRLEGLLFSLKRIKFLVKPFIFSE